MFTGYRYPMAWTDEQAARPRSSINHEKTVRTTVPLFRPYDNVSVSHLSMGSPGIRATRPIRLYRFTRTHPNFRLLQLHTYVHPGYILYRVLNRRSILYFRIQSSFRIFHIYSRIGYLLIRPIFRRNLFDGTMQSHGEKFERV